MIGAALAAALLLCGSGQTHQLIQSAEKLGHADFSQDNFVHRWIGRALGGLAGRVASGVVNLSVKHGSPSDATAKPKSDDEDDSDDEKSDDADLDSDDDSTLHINVNVQGKDGRNTSIVVSPRAPMPPVPPIPPVPPAADGRGLISEHAHGVPSVELLHNIASAAGWSLTLAGVGRDKIDVDFDDLEPNEALRTVLLKANCMGVLRGDKLVVIAAGTGGGHAAGLLVEQRGGDGGPARNRSGRRSADLVKVGGDLIVPAGTMVKGDAVAILGSVEVEPGAVVQGTVAAIGGNVTVQPGAVVMEDSVAILGENVERGGQVLGDHVQVAIGPLFSSAQVRHHSFLSRIGPFGLFPTLALFAIVYLLGLIALRLWPERMRAIGGTLAENPLRSFVIGFLCWLFSVPLLILLVISVVGIVLIPLLPLAVGLSVMLGACALAMKIGEALPAGEGQKFVPPAALGMGLTAMLLVSLVPWIGTPLLVLVLFVAPGAVISSRFGRSLPSA